MFTGIIEAIGIVRSAGRTEAGRRLKIDLGRVCEGLKLGDSVAVSGACLTLSALDGANGEFDVVRETLSKTTLGSLAGGSKVNLERSLRLGDGLDGHLVQGHVDAVAEVRSIRRGDQWLVEFTAGADLTRQMVPKGSVTVDGVSLTLVDVSERAFSVALIPTTLSETTLCELVETARVNVEADLIGKYVRKHLAGMLGSGGSSSLTLDKLKESGFA